MNIKQAMSEAVTLSRNGAAMAVILTAGSYLVVADACADEPLAIAHDGRIVYQKEAMPCA